MSEEEREEVEAADKKIKEAIESRNTERLKRMEQIADGSEKNRAADFDDAEAREAAAAAEDAEAQAQAKKLQEEGIETPEPEAESDTRVTNGETYYRQVVNGVEKWQTLAQIRQTAQKVESADEYLRAASESVRNASRQALSPVDVPSRPGKDGLKKLLASAVLGDEEAIEQLASALDATPSVTPDVLQAVDQRLSFRTELAALEAEYKDLLGDDELGMLFRVKIQQLAAQNPQMNLSAAYRQVGESLRGKFSPVLKGSTVSAKLERKRTLVNPPTASQRQSVEAEEEGEEDLSDVIDRMAKARGLSPILHRKSG
jgi:hypothetical protein